MTIKELKDKRTFVLASINRLCSLFGISDYDYELYLSEDGFYKETLRIYNTRIDCTSFCIEQIIKEVVGYIYFNLLMF